MKKYNEVKNNNSKIDIEKGIKEGLKALDSTYNNEENNIIIEKRATISSNLAVFYWKLEEFENSKKYFFLSLKEFEKIHDTFKIASTKGALGSLYLELGEYQISQKYNEEAYEYWKNTTFLNERIACLQNLGMISLRNKEEVEASNFILEALKMAISLQDENQFVITIQILLEYYEKQKRYDMLLELKKKALEFWDLIDVKERQVKTLIDIGVILQILDDFESAITNFKKAFNIAYNLGDIKKMFITEGFLAESYIKIKEIEKAKQIYLQAFKLAIYMNATEDYQQDVNSMRLALLSLGYSVDEIVKEGQKALSEAKKDLEDNKKKQ